MASKYDNMTKEEIIAEMRKRNKKYSWRKALILTPKEGNVLENNILPQFDCENPSQFLKKIVHGDIIVSRKE